MYKDATTTGVPLDDLVWREPIKEYKYRPTGLQGWICPRCGRGMSPWVRECDCVNKNSWRPWEVIYNRR